MAAAAYPSLPWPVVPSEAVMMIAARSTFPFEPKLPSFLQRALGTPPLEVSLAELTPLASANLDAARRRARASSRCRA